MKRTLADLDLMELITLRNHLWTLINGPRDWVAKRDIQPLNNFVRKIDANIIAESLAMAKEEFGDAQEEMLDIAKKIAAAKAALADSPARKMTLTQTGVGNGDVTAPITQETPVKSSPQTLKKKKGFARVEAGEDDGIEE